MSETPVRSVGIIGDQSTTPATVAPETASSPRSRGPSLLHLAIVVAILGGGVLITALTSDVTQVSEPGIRVFEDTAVTEDGATVVVERPYLPERAGDWVGSELTGLSQAERDILPKDTQGARRLFTDPEGRQIYCSIVLAGKDVTSIHRPELCLPGQGWTIQSAFVEGIPVATAENGVLDVMRLNTARAIPVAEGQTIQAYSIFNYWFVGKDRVTPHHWQRIFWTTEDRVLHNTNHRWAYILIHVPVGQPGKIGELEKAQAGAMDLARNFIQALYPELTVK